MLVPPDADHPQFHPPAIVRKADVLTSAFHFEEQQEADASQHVRIEPVSWEESYRRVGAWIRDHRREMDARLGIPSQEEQWPTIMRTRQQLQAVMEDAASKHWGERAHLIAIARMSPWLPQDLVDRISSPYGPDAERPLTRKERREQAVSAEEGHVAKKGWY